MTWWPLAWLINTPTPSSTSGSLSKSYGHQRTCRIQNATDHPSNWNWQNPPGPKKAEVLFEKIWATQSWQFAQSLTWVVRKQLRAINKQTPLAHSPRIFYHPAAVWIETQNISLRNFQNPIPVSAANSSDKIHFPQKCVSPKTTSLPPLSPLAPKRFQRELRRNIELSNSWKPKSEVHTNSSTPLLLLLLLHPKRSSHRFSA